MAEVERLEQRIAAVERVVDGDLQLDELADLEGLSERIPDLEAGVQSLEGYVGNTDSVNEDVCQQANTAVATVGRLERRIERLGDDVRTLRHEATQSETNRIAGLAVTPLPPARTDQAESEHTLECTERDTEPPDAAGQTAPTRTIIDDGSDRELASATSAGVETAVSERTPTEAGDSSGRGVLETLRARLS